MNILVTGGAGFLGSHLCDRLLGDGHQVICVDNLLTGQKENINHLLDNPNFEFIELDVCELEKLGERKVDAIYHLASPASPYEDSPKSYHSLPFQTMAVNTTGTWKCCEFALKNGAKLLFASTSEAYGDPLEHPQKESYRGNVSTTGPRSVYDESKRFGETITSAFFREKKLDARIIRIFNTYGPRINLEDGRVVIEFLSRAMRNEQIIIFGDGSQTRSFCYVDDLVDGIVKAMETEGTTAQVFNLGNPGEFSILELANKIKEITGSSSEIKYEGLPEDDPMKRQPDITKAREKLGWEPKIGLDEGLKRLLEYLKSAQN